MLLKIAFSFLKPTPPIRRNASHTTQPALQKGVLCFGSSSYTTNSPLASTASISVGR